MSERYINPFTDFGFKKLFGEEANKELLLDFLNEIIRERGRIAFLKGEHIDLQDWQHAFKLCYDKLPYLYIEVSWFNKTEEELETHFDKWMYVWKNLARLQDMPAKLQEKIFYHLFQAAEIARYSPSERQSYQHSLKCYRDLKNSLDTARENGFEKGFKEGLQKGKEEGLRIIARRLLASGMPPEQIALSLSLNEQEVQRLRDGKR